MVLSAGEAMAPLSWSANDWCRTQFRAMGTVCQMIYRAPSRKQAISFRDVAVEWVMDFERKYSRYRNDSLISAINRAAGESWVATDTELESIFALCDHYHWSTAGVFDPSTLPLMRLWDYKVQRPVLPGDAKISEAMELVGWQKVQRRAGEVFLPQRGMAIDLGGIGKEYAVDRVLDQSRAFGINDLMVDFGRDVRGVGQAPQGGAWRVGLEHPVDHERCWGGVAVLNRAVTTSGDYLRGLEIDGTYYSHIVDPRTGRPISNGCHSASVVAPTCTEAGVLSTAALILGREEGLRLIERSTFAQGCIWQGQDRHDTARFAGYLIP
jgi:thiamine biosynthesis lipoprotein